MGPIHKQSSNQTQTHKTHATHTYHVDAVDEWQTFQHHRTVHNPPQHFVSVVPPSSPSDQESIPMAQQCVAMM